MHINMNAARRRAAALLKRFPAHEVTVKRPLLSQFGEDSGVYEVIGTVTAWRYSQSRAKSSAEGYSVADGAQNYADDDAFWLCMPIDAALSAQHGDICTLDDARYVIRNIDDRGGLLVYWQLGRTGQVSGA